MNQHSSSAAPVISVVIASYNHERYIRECVQSVLDQSYQNFEILITDDGSSDASVSRVMEMDDPRIHLRAFERNQGACAAMNDAIRRSRGQYIAVLNSDDVFLPGKLARQVALLDTRPDLGAVFGWPQFIDERGQPFHDPAHKDHDVFHVSYPDRFGWLRHFFDERNALCHPTGLIRRSVYEQVGLYDQRLAQVPDLDMWIRLCSHANLLVEPVATTGFRIRDGLQNASAARPEVVVRDAWERACVLHHYTALPTADLCRVFPEFEPSQTSAAEFLAARALAIGHPFYQRFALDVLFGNLPPNNGPLPPIKSGWTWWRRPGPGQTAAPAAQWQNFHAVTGMHDIHRLFPKN